jgi:predicted transcriptional regulator YheO
MAVNKKVNKITKKPAALVKKTKTVKKSLEVVKSNSVYLKEEESTSGVLCIECDEPISLARIRIIKTDTCVACMEQLERQDQIQRVRMLKPKLKGTQRHHMEFEVEGSEEVEAVNLHLRRGG